MPIPVMNQSKGNSESRFEMFFTLLILSGFWPKFISCSISLNQQIGSQSLVAPEVDLFTMVTEGPDLLL